MLMMPHGPAFGNYSYSRDVDIPPMNGIPFRHIDQQSLLVRPAINHLHFRELYPLLVPRRCGDTGHHHELDKLLTFPRQFPALCFL